MAVSTTPELKSKTRKVIGVQITVGLLLALGAAIMFDQWHGLSLLYGTMISTLSSMWLAYGVAKAAADSGRGGEIALYVGAAARFIMVAVLFVIALAVLKLAAIPTVVGFIVAQLAFVVAGNWREKTDEKSEPAEKSRQKD